MVHVHRRLSLPTPPPPVGARPCSREDVHPTIQRVKGIPPAKYRGPVQPPPPPPRSSVTVKTAGSPSAAVRCTPTVELSLTGACKLLFGSFRTALLVIDIERRRQKRLGRSEASFQRRIVTGLAPALSSAYTPPPRPPWFVRRGDGWL